MAVGFFQGDSPELVRAQGASSGIQVFHTAVYMYVFYFMICTNTHTTLSSEDICSSCSKLLNSLKVLKYTWYFFFPPFERGQLSLAQREQAYHFNLEEMYQMKSRNLLCLQAGRPAETCSLFLPPEWRQGKAWRTQHPTPISNILKPSESRRTMNTSVSTRLKNDATTRALRDVDDVSRRWHGRKYTTQSHHTETDTEGQPRHTRGEREGRWHRIEFKMSDKWDPDFMGCNRSGLEINGLRWQSMKSDT